MDDFSSISEHLLQFAPDALVVVDPQGIIRFANETTAAVFGYPREALVGVSMQLLIPNRFRARHAGHVSSFLLNPTNREMGARISDLYARPADGSEFPAAIRLAPFRSGDPSFVAAPIRDLTERRAISVPRVAAREHARRATPRKAPCLAAPRRDSRQSAPRAR